ncbi:hypothetical protein GCT13_25270 [Paraburkholderia sp. CNPSo 3157]|uniref:Uncharacterized protein n=1 Tax=Paraburkholderia franconis TaxID=2654983 RepID=A0A7X1NDS1_9BURK|nr:hypothetical protein [Paraburkholderia franconis]MPW20109.1 hypothetical protein [Paraburkholderia franconis]
MEFSYDQGNPAEVAQDSGNFIKIRVNIFGGGIANGRLFLSAKQFAALRRKRPKSVNSESATAAAPMRSKASLRAA